MRLIVFSDSHGNFTALKRVIDLHTEADAYIHLGDGAEEVEMIKMLYHNKKFICVCGNCDVDSDEKLSRVEVFDNKTVYFTHGHYHNVKYTDNYLIEAAKQSGADIVLYGHTHISREEYLNGIYIMNPGSISKPKNTQRPTYGIVDITNSGILMSIAELKYE